MANAGLYFAKTCPNHRGIRIIEGLLKFNYFTTLVRSLYSKVLNVGIIMHNKLISTCKLAVMVVFTCILLETGIKITGSPCPARNLKQDTRE